MKVLKVITSILLYSFSGCYAMEQSTHSIIPEASYYIVKGTERSFPVVGGIPIPLPEYATFYNASGDEIIKVTREECDFFVLRSKLDPNAAKPKAATFAIRYWPAISIGFGLKKGCPGYFIVFSDKNGNHIESYRYNEKTKKIKIFDPEREVDSILDIESVDTKDCRELGSDDIKDHHESSCNVQ